jgi:drug/metabolite transporter (DMT)-like permease
MLTGATIIMVPLALAVDGVPHLDLSAKTLAAIGWYSAAGTALAYLLFYRVMRAAGSGNAQLVTLMVPLVAITLGALVLGEALAPHVWAGFGLLILGLVIIDGRAAGALGRRLFV